MNAARGAVVVLFGLILAGFGALARRPESTLIEGRVTDASGPVEGALVRLQASSVCTHTDADGRFRIAKPRVPRLLTAAKPGRAIAVGAANNPRLELPAIPHKDNDDYLWIDSSPDPNRPLQCANCHAQIHDEWSQSAHAHAAKNRKFLSLFAGTDGAAPPLKVWNLLEEHPLGSGVCASCHAPTLTSPSLDYDVREARGVNRLGVHCDYCHKIAEAPTDKLGTRFGRDGYRLARPSGKEQIFFGPLDDAVRAGETFVYVPFYKESRYCASCHEGVIFGVHVYGTYSEWLESPARRQGQECQHCHMTPAGTMTNIAPGNGGVRRDPHTLASHGFPGGTAEMLKKCLEVKTEVARNGQDIAVTVRVQARNVGHRVPTGFIDRHLILVVDALDEDEKLMPPSTGPRLPPRAGAALAGRAGLIFGKQHLDAKGQPIPFWKTGTELLDTRLRPDDADQRRFVFAANAAMVRVRLIYRRFWSHVAETRAWEDNDLLVHETNCHSPDKSPAR